MRLLQILLIMWSFNAYAEEAKDYFFNDISLKNAKSIEFLGLNHRTWVNNTVEWWYNPAKQVFVTEETIQAITNATLAWQNISGVKFVYKGITNQNLSSSPDDKLVIGWLDQQTFIQAAGNYAGFTRTWWRGNNVIDSDVSLNIGDKHMTSSINNLQALMTHEFGHVLGLDHSDNPGSIMYSPYHTYEYQMSLRTDDVNAARSLYPCECGDWHRVFNWAESNYPTLFKVSNKRFITIAPYNIRYYPETDAYLGYNPDDHYFYGLIPAIWGQQIVKFGALPEYLSTAIQAGF